MATEIKGYEPIDTSKYESWIQKEFEIAKSIFEIFPEKFKDDVIGIILKYYSDVDESRIKLEINKLKENIKIHFQKLQNKLKRLENKLEKMLQKKVPDEEGINEVVKSCDAIENEMMLCSKGKVSLIEELLQQIDDSLQNLPDDCRENAENLLLYKIYNIPKMVKEKSKYPKVLEEPILNLTKEQQEYFDRVASAVEQQSVLNTKLTDEEKAKDKEQEELEAFLIAKEESPLPSQYEYSPVKTSFKLNKNPFDEWITDWRISKNGNPTRCIHGKWLTIIKSKFHKSRYTFSADRDIDWRYQYPTINIAKIAAFFFLLENQRYSYQQLVDRSRGRKG